MGRVGIAVAASVIAVMAGGIAVAAALTPSDEPLTVVAPVTETPTATPTAIPTLTPTATPTPTAAYDLTSPTSLTVLVNKRHPLDPITYAPSDLVAMADLGILSMNGHSLRKPAADAIVALFAAAQAAGHTLDMTSGYRDVELQTELYDEDVAQNGQASADALTARPGYSEHQTGLAADLSAPDESECVLTECFAETGAGQWLAANSWKYGFILRYPKGGEAVTGIQFEPWHFRFIGVDAAAAFHASGASTYEEFLGLEPAPTYQ